MKRFSSILIANRGEIAVRIARTAQRLGYRVIAVYSDADVSAPHVQLADDAVRIGASAPRDSYLHAASIFGLQSPALCGLWRGSGPITIAGTSGAAKASQ